MWNAFKKHNGEVVVASSLKLKARDKLFWMGGRERSDGVGVFVAEKWVVCVVGVERVLILKMVLDDDLVNVLMVYAPHSWKPKEEKQLFHLVSCKPQNEMIVLAGDRMDMLEVLMLATMGCIVVLGMELGMQMAPVSWSLHTG